MFMGLTVATIGGVPAATWLGDAVGWRMAFGCVAVIGAVAMAALWRALPRLPAESPTEIAGEIRVLLSCRCRRRC